MRSGSHPDERSLKAFCGPSSQMLSALQAKNGSGSSPAAAALTMLEALLSRKSFASSGAYRSLNNEVWKAYEEYCIHDDSDALQKRLVAAYNSYDGADTVSEREQLSLPRRRRNVLRAGMDVESEAGLDVVLAELGTARVPDGVRGAFSRAC